MDADVNAAMQRWPNVPAAYGWLRLDQRGQWYLIDRNTPGFDQQLDGQGSLVRNERLIEFISRNYLADAAGRWYFQNGPQRVFVNLGSAPLVWRVDDSDGRLKWVSHIGGVALQTLEAGSDSRGHFFIRTELGVGAVDDRHLGRLAAWLQSTASAAVQLSTGDHTIQVQAISDPEKHFGFVLTPSDQKP
jgi:hypothetical protein